MAKKKKTDNGDDEQRVIEMVTAIAPHLPYDKIALSVVFTYAWWRAYGLTEYPTKNDVMLGIAYALLIPPALQGGMVANSFATGAIATLIAGLEMPPSYFTDPLTKSDAEAVANSDPESFWSNIVGMLSDKKDAWERYWATRSWIPPEIPAPLEPPPDLN